MIKALDTETSFFHNNPYDQTNEPAVCYSVATDEMSGAYLWDTEAIQREIDEADLIVGFNFKFDMGWLRKYGIKLAHKRFWDVQLAESVISRQLWKFPSLGETCTRYGLPKKIDVVQLEYWDKGIDTKDVPWPILEEYAATDAKLTLACYHAQLKHLSPAQIQLVKLMSMDSLVLQEMEMNGIKYDEKLCKVKEKELDDEISKIESQLKAIYPQVPINFGSPDMLSAFLYGGQVVEPIKVHEGFFKTGARAGQPKYRNSEVLHTLPRLFTPIKGSELKKPGLYGTSEGVLKKLRPLDKKDKYIIDDLLRLAKLETLNSKYFKGLPALNREMNWPKEKLHGNFNQTLAVSGRLSSNKPNQQNFASELQDIFITELD